MTEPTPSKRQKCDNGNGSHEQNNDELTISSSSIDDLNEELAKHQKAPANLLSEADRALQESNKRHIKPVVDEAKLGIELFVGDRTKQYHGLIKSRYADFIVHEIGLDGQMAQLTSLEMPEEEKPDSPDAIKLEDLFDRKVLMCLSNVNQGLLDCYKIDVTGMDKDMRTSIHMAIKAAYERLDSSTVSGEDGKPDFKKEPKDSVKQQHQEDNLESSDNKTNQSSVPENQNESSLNKPDTDNETTVETTASAADDAKQDKEVVIEKKYILVKKQNKPSRPKNVWPKSRPDHTYFVLYKENKDTMDAIHNLAVATYSKPSQFNYAGTKDRRAVTTQWVSSWRLDPRRLINAMRRFNRRPFLKVGNFCFKNDSIRLGQLRANKFDIVIRNLVHNSGGVAVIEDAMNYVKENGFVNYFGLQRFGSRSVYTHEIGLAILQGRWEKAVELILSYRYDDSTQPLPNIQDQNQETSNSNQAPGGVNPNTESTTVNNLTGFGKQNQRNQTKRWVSGAEQHNACIDLWKVKQDADLVFKKYPHFKVTNEGLIIRSLNKSSGAYFNYHMAVESLPRNTRSMYVHAYQSLIWNKITTFRLKNFGYKVIPGDLILRPDANISDNSLDILLAVDETDTPETESVLAKVEGEKMADRKMPVEEIDANIIIAEEKDLDKFSIFDVVLPLIGTKTRIPTNDIGKELERLLAEDNLTLESFRAREQAFISYGSYRKIMVRPANLEWCLKQYSNPHQNLIDTDLDLLQGKGIATGNDQSLVDKELESTINSGSSDEALVVSFELPPSAYATMCLRELMKKPSTDFNNRF